MVITPVPYRSRVTSQPLEFHAPAAFGAGACRFMSTRARRREMFSVASNHGRDVKKSEPNNQIVARRIAIIMNLW